MSPRTTPRSASPRTSSGCCTGGGPVDERPSSPRIPSSPAPPPRVDELERRVGFRFRRRGRGPRAWLAQRLGRPSILRRLPVRPAHHSAFLLPVQALRYRRPFVPRRCLVCPDLRPSTRRRTPAAPL